MTMIVPFAAGGAVDVLARALGARTAEILGQQIIIENVAGAGGMTGANRVAKAAPDGYTFVLGSVGTHAQNQTLYKTPAYDAQKDFEPVALVSELPLLLVAKRDLPANDLQEFIAYAKANDGKLQFGSAGVGSAVHLGCVLFNAAAGIKATHIPYRGGGPAMQDLVAGRIDYTCNIITSALPQHQRQPDQGHGQSCAQAHAAPARFARPRRSRAWTTSTPPPGTWCCCPRARPRRSCRSSTPRSSQALDTPTTTERLLNIGLDIPAPEKRSPEYAAKFVESEIRKYEGPIKAAGIVIE